MRCIYRSDLFICKQIMNGARAPPLPQGRGSLLDTLKQVFCFRQSLLCTTNESFGFGLFNLCHSLNLLTVLLYAIQIKKSTKFG